MSDTRIEPDLEIPEGSRVVIDMQTANRDLTVFGSDACEFNPFRKISSDIAPWGLSFGSGFHACIGQELVSGLEQTSTDTEVPLTGALATMAQIVLQKGAVPDPSQPARRDVQSLRQNWIEYPVVFQS